MHNKGYALIDVLTTLTCMVMVASYRMSISMTVGSRNETNEHARNVHGEVGNRGRENQVEDQHNDERWRLNISYPASDHLRVE